MLSNQLVVELKRVCSTKNLLLWIAIIIVLPTTRFFTIREGYLFFKPIEVFQEMVSTFIPLLFPALVIIIYLSSFVQEQRNNFISYTRSRIPLSTYILSKGIINAFFSGLISFLLIFIPFLFIMYLEPKIGLISYTHRYDYEYTVIPKFTFSQLISYGNFTYGLIYSLWVSINAIVYSTIAFLLLLVINNPFIALSVPFLFYHIFNFLTGVIGVPQYSPLSTIFPFNIIQQPLWTILVPFSFLISVFIGLLIFANHKQKEWIV